MKAAWGVAYKAACVVCLVCLAVVLGVAVHYGWRALVADTFVIPSDSMSPTLLPGDKVRVERIRMICSRLAVLALLKQSIILIQN